MKNSQRLLAFFAIPLLLASACLRAQTNGPVSFINQPADLSEVKVLDSFWSPKYRVWTTKTVYDVLDKLEGHYEPDRQDLIEDKRKTGRTQNAFLNFDRVAKGDTNTKQFDGLPWFDGLVYETIRGAADLLRQYPDKKLEARLDAYINRIAKAQAADPDGFINTYTTLNRPGQRWGTNGGDDKWQHDVYNAGMLTEAAVHYYMATRKTQLLQVAVKMNNYICRQMGPQPKLNVIPGHGGPEEALLKLYWLFKKEPSLAKKISVEPVVNDYYATVKFWIENRGNYGNADGSHARVSDGAYNQDHEPVLQQKTIEGHAVRATLLATGVASMAMENNSTAYVNTANRYWDNMIGRRLFITGGQGAIADQEKFGPDYYLPETAYGETCASIGSAFFSQRMNQLLGEGKFMDEFERVIYNNLLSGVSLSGDHYFYENPLVASNHQRWAWHSCPCCPPMILKLVSALPGYIYSNNQKDIKVNLFIGSEYKGRLDSNAITIKQTTQYPWKGLSEIEIIPTVEKAFTISVRIPGWATGKENFYGLYHSDIKGKVQVLLNGKVVETKPVDGYVAIHRIWRKGDKITVSLPVEPRLVFPTDSIQTVKGKAVIAAGPVVYGFEKADNVDFDKIVLSKSAPLIMNYQPALLGGVNVITNQQQSFTAIPFYSLSNRNNTAGYKVWVPVNE